MTLAADQRNAFEQASRGYPFPVAVACRRFLDSPPKDDWQEWERLSRDVLPAVLQYLSHLLLSDLVATERKPPRLFHRIESILSRPLTGHYVGFLRDTAVYYRDENLVCAVPELISFVLAADADCSLTGDGKPLLGTLVDYRNLWAHGRPENTKVTAEIVEVIRRLTTRLLEEIRFLTRYPLQLGDGPALMGSELPELPKESMPLVVITAGAVPLRPLLLKLKGSDLAQLDEADLSGMRLGYRGSSGYTRLQKKDLKSGDGAKLFEEMKALVSRVRAVDAVLESPDWTTFNERSAVVTDRVLALYEEMRKYVPRWYVPRPGWHGPEGLFRKFLDSDRSLLAISGVQGTGKSALAANLAAEAREAGHAVLFINAQRFTFADVSWTGTPYPGYFASLLHYSSPFDRPAFARILKTAEPGKQVVLFIEAINEVDGIESKWNRFRAMELLLEWLVSIAQPGLKVVLSFRVDAYEEYEYLQAEELPPTLGSIAYPGNHPTQRWVIELEPFDEAQAEALFHHLQKEPQFGMAPAMSWEEIRRGLGEHLAEFTDNPLLFTILLRVHHGVKETRTGTREELFSTYAAKLSGAAGVARRPWYRRLWGFVRNGNITPHESFLKVLLEKMAEVGNSALPLESLGPMRTARDRRLLAFVRDPSSTAYQDLLDGGLLVEEKVEVEQADGSRTSTRLGFVSELMGSALACIERKVKRRGAFRKLVLALVGLWIVLPLCLRLGMSIHFHYGRWGHTGFPWLSSFLLSSTWKTFCPWYLVLGASVSVLFAALTAAEIKISVPAEALGLLESGAYSKQNNAGVRLLAVSAITGVATVVLISLVTLLCNVEPSLPLVAAGLGAILCQSWVLGHIHLFMYAGGSLAVPQRLSRRTNRNLVEVYRGGHLRKTRAGFAVIGLASVLIAIAWNRLEIPPQAPPANLPVAMSLDDLRQGRLIRGYAVGMSSLSLFGDGAPLWLGLGLVLGVLALCIGGVLLVPALSWAEGRPPRHAVHAWRKTAVLTTLAVLASAGMGFLLDWSWRHQRPRPMAEVSRLTSELRRSGVVLKESMFTADDYGRVEQLELRQRTTSNSVCKVVSRLRHLKVLILPDSTRGVVDLSGMHALERLEGPAAALRGLSRPPLSGLNLLGDTDFATIAGSPTVRDLGLMSTFRGAELLPEKFPLLSSISFDDSVMGNDPVDIPLVWQNQVLSVRGDASPQLKWLRPSHAAAIVSLAKPPSEDTQNMDLLTRLWLPSLAWNPLVLRHAPHLRWLILSSSRMDLVPLAWWGSLREVVEQSLPELGSLDIVVDGMPKHAAVGRDKVLKLLDSIVKDPQGLGLKPLVRRG
jgi:hypothetical protein